jgi:aspartate racemase
MLPYIIRSIKQLERAGAGFIVLPCNTLHEILPTLKKETKVPIMDLLEETTKILTKYKQVGMLASTRTKESGIYNKYSKNTKILYPAKEEQEIISQIIVKIIRRSYSEADKLEINKIISNLKGRGAERVVLACTDLANMIEKNDFLLDTQEILISSIKNMMES